MIEELLLWLWLFLRVSGFVQQVAKLGPRMRWFFLASLRLFCQKKPSHSGPVSWALCCMRKLCNVGHKKYSFANRCR